MQRRSSSSSRPASSVRPGRHQGKFIYAGLGIAVGALLWFAPAIVVNSPLRRTVLDAALAGIQAKASVGSISVGWLSPIVVRGVTIVDAAGGPLLDAEEVRTKQSLAGLLADRVNVGEVQILRPMLHVTLRPDGSNLEDALGDWLQRPRTGPTPVVNVKVVEGTVRAVDATAQTTWLAEKVDASVSVADGTVAPISGQLRADIHPDGRPGGTIAGQAIWQRDGTALGKGNASLETSAMPLSVAELFLRRAFPSTQLLGVAAAKLALDWNAAGQSVRIEQATFQDVEFQCAELIPGDQVSLKSAALAGAVQRRNGFWQVDGVSLQGDFFQLTAAGSGQAPPDGPLAAELLSVIGNGQVRVEGDVQLAPITQMLRHTLRMREETHLTGGQVRLNLTTAASNGGGQWEANLTARDIAGVHQGHKVAWEQPITINVRAHQDQGQLAIDEVAAQAEFAQVRGTGSLRQGAATFQGDLSQFMAQLTSFVDLGGWHTAGTLDGQVSWEQVDARHLRVITKGNAKQFELASPSGRPLRDAHLQVDSDLLLAMADAQVQAIDQAKLVVSSGADRLDAAWAVGGTSGGTPPLTVQLQGDLGNWLARVKPFAGLDGLDAAGQIDLNAQGVVGADQIDLREGRANLKNLQVTVAGRTIAEPEVRITAVGAWDRNGRTWRGGDTTFASSAVAFSSRDLMLDFRDSAPRVAGNLLYRGDLHGLAKWLSNSPTQSLKGDASGSLALRAEGNAIDVQWDANVENFSYLARSTAAVGAVRDASLPGWRELWSEPVMKIKLAGALDQSAGKATIRRLETATGAASLAAVGSIEDLRRRCLLDLRGEIAYDLAQVSQRLRPQLGDALQMAGVQTKPFTFRGPLFPAESTAEPALRPSSTAPAAAGYGQALKEMHAQFNLGWQSLLLKQIEVGPGELQGQLQNGQLEIVPVSLPISGGTIRLQPTISLDRDPLTLLLPAGNGIEQMRISPEICRGWLKYFAPYLADATAAEGTFSLILDRAAVPLSQPLTSTVQGEMTIHQARVGPGPLALEILGFAGLVKGIAEGRPFDAASNSFADKWLELPPQKFAVEVIEGRVHHRGIQMNVGNVVVYTTGSVGLDQTLAMTAEVPVQDAWVANNRFLATLRGKKIQVPIAGTLTRPQLDRSALQQFTRQSITEAAGGVLQQKLNRQLERGLESLLRPR